ncbi:MAG: phage holin family protein [Oscillospiraceae bacterium]
MKDTITKGIISALAAGITAYFRLTAIPIIVLFGFMIIDYGTGMTKAYIAHSISSRTGIVGILKKLSYFCIVAVAMGVDWILSQGLLQFSVHYSGKYFISLLIIIWLMINELISILENVAAIGAPVPQFLIRIVKRLKSAADTETDKIETEEKQHGK